MDDGWRMHQSAASTYELSYDRRWRVRGGKGAVYGVRGSDGGATFGHSMWV